VRVIDLHLVTFRRPTRLLKFCVKINPGFSLTRHPSRFCPLNKGTKTSTESAAKHCTNANKRQVNDSFLIISRGYPEARDPLRQLFLIQICIEFGSYRSPRSPQRALRCCLEQPGAESKTLQIIELQGNDLTGGRLPPFKFS
jgi:hypothetical protein